MRWSGLLLRFVPLLLGGGAAIAPLARALVLGGTAAAQTLPPADNPGWDNVVSPNGCSGVYLGNQWVLTASHVGAGSVTLGSTTYSVQPGSAVRLRTPAGTGDTDLTLFRLAADPGLPAISLVSAPLPPHTSVTMIGCGCTRGDSVSYDSSWVGNGMPAQYTGYLWDTPAKSWGTNRIAGTITADDGYGSIVASVIDFTFPGPGSDATTDEAQGALYDSGGAVFAKLGGSWQLAGIMVAVGTYAGQPASTAIFGNATYAMELATYRPQVEAVRALTTPYEIWQYDRFRGQATTATGDPDGDGFTNLQEYAFGMNPLLGDATGGPQTALANYADGWALTVTYTHNTAATDAQIVVEVSSNLADWQAGEGATAVVSTTARDGNLEQVIVRDLTTVSGAARRFLRVRVTK